MKNLITYLKTLWSRGVGLQRSEVRVTSGGASDEHPMSTRSASDGDRWKSAGNVQAFWKYAAMLVMLFTIGSGNVWGTDVTDVITASNLAATGTTYTDFSGVSITSDAVYAGNSAKNGDNIQLRSKNSNSGIVSTTSGGNRVKSVKITVGSGSNTVDVYGKTSAYSGASDLYSSSTQGTKIGSVSATGTITVTGDYTYVGIRSNNGAIYLSSIEITWETGGGGTVATPTFSPAAGTYDQTQSVSIDCATGGATIYYTTDGSTPTASSSVYSGAISVTATTTIKAFATKSGLTDSSVGSATYTLQCTAPTFDNAAGTYCGASLNVKVSNYNSNYTYYYTTNGNDPTNASTAYDHSTGIELSATGSSQTLKMIAYRSTITCTVTSAAYTITNIANTQETAYTVAQARALIDANVCLTQAVYVKGYVKEITTPFNGTYGNISFDITDNSNGTGDTFRFYRNFKGAGNTKWASADEAPQKGNYVIGYGTLTKYNSTYEFAEGNYCVVNSATAYTITAVSNNNSYGTVALAGSTITATPNSGYRVSTTTAYTVTSGTATVTNNGDGTFSVTPSSDCTVRINFESIPTHTISFDTNGLNSIPSVTVAEGATHTITEAPTGLSGSCEYPDFVGWTTESSTYVHGTSPLYTTSITMSTGDITLHAVYSKTTGGGASTWNQVTDATDVTAGTYVIVASTTSYTGYLPNNGAGDAAPAFTTGVTISDGRITSSVTDAMKWTFSSGSWDDDENYMENITITSVEETPRYLHNINNNNGVRINSESGTWTIGNHESGTSDVLYLWCNGRYCGVYNNADWRSYTTYDATNYEADAGSSKILLFKQTAGGTTTYSLDAGCCTPLGTINGSVSLSQLASPDPTKLKATWTMNAETGIASYTLEVYDNSDNLVKTINNYTSGSEITGLDPCTTYYVKLYTVSSGTVGLVTYCDGGLIGTSSTCTTNGWGVSESLTNTTHVTGASSVCPASNYVATYTATAGNVLPSSVSVSIGGVAKTQGTHYTWSVSSGTGTLTVLAANITTSTGAIAISISSSAAACSSYSFHDGTHDVSDWQINCFTYSGNSDRQWLKNFTVRNKPNYYVGYQGSFYNDNLGNSNAKSYENEMQYMQLALDRGHNSNNQLGSNYAGVQGTLLCYDNSNSDNLFVDFLPDGYYFILDAAGTPTALPMTCTNADMTAANILSSNSVWETAVQTVTSVSYKYTVGLKADAAIAGKAWQTTRYNTNEDMTTLKKRNSSGGFTGTLAAADVTAGTRGKYRIWANNFSTTAGEKNWYAHFVPYFRVTYDGSGASGSTTASIDVSCEGNDAARTVQAAANEFTVPTGKSFGGWASSPENAAAGTVAYAANANIVLTSSITLYAIWTDIDYTVTVNQSPSVGATTTGQTSSAHYNTTINLTTTVPSGYRFVNWTTSDGFAIANNTSATTASFTMPNKNVTVTANFQQTHKVDWYVGGSAPANKIGDDGQTTVVDHGGKISDFPAHDPDGSACDKTFVGWTNTTSYVHGTSPLFNDVAGSPTINADANFYAVFAEAGDITWTRVTSVSTITGGGTFIIGYEGTANSGVLVPLRNNDGTASTSANGILYSGTTSGSSTTGTITMSSLGNNGGDDYEVTITSGTTSGKVSIKLANNNYIGVPTSGNNVRLYAANNTTYTDITPTIGDDDVVNLMMAADSALRYNTGGSQRFVRYKTSTGAGVVLYKKTGGYTGHTINCASCSNEVEVAYDADPAGGTVAVVKGSTPIAENGTVKTCTGSVALTVTVTPANAHFSVSGVTFTPSDGLTAGELSGTSSPASTTDGVWTYNVTIAQDADGTLTISPSFNEDAHKVITWVVHGGSASIADGHGTTWVYSGENLTGIPSAPSAPAGCVDKEFVGWSENDGGATEGDASDYSDRFTTLGGAPTGITTDKTFTAVFATPAAGLGGTVMWEDPFDGYSNGDQPASKSGYNSATISYAYGESGTKVYAGADQHYAGGSQPELMIVKNGGSFMASNIPTASQTELTLTYKTNYSANVSVTSGTSGVTVGDADVSGTTCTRTITISQSPATSNFALTFTMTKSDKNARVDDIRVAVPGSSSMSGYVTSCEETWTITYYKNTEDAVTNLPSPTGISKSTGSGTLSSKVPVRYGYTFDGWATSAGGSVAYAAGASINSVSADVDLYAKWSVTPVTEINLSKTSLDKYVGDPSVILSVLSVLPDGANTSVTWSSSNSSIATVNSSTGEVNFVAEGTANIIATSSITSGTTATCVVTVWAKPTVSFLDNLHSLTEDKDGNALSGYNLTDVAGTPVVFPILANQSAGSGTCEDEHYVFVGWTTSDNNTDPDDHLVTSHNLTNGDNITYYAVWADGVAGTTYTKLTNNTFKTSPTKYVIGAEREGITYYFYSCEKTDKDNSWGYSSADVASHTPFEFTLSGTAAALVAASTEVSTRYLDPLESNGFQMSASSQTVELKSDGKIYNTDDASRRLLYNYMGGSSSSGMRWYSSVPSGCFYAYFYEVVAGGEVNYRTSCCADKVAAPTVTATKTSTTITLTWAAVSGATGYELQWNGGAWTAATSGVVKSDLTPNTNYSWRVRATYTTPKCGADIASGNTTTNQVYHVTYAKGSGTGSCNATSSTTDATAYEAGVTVTLQSNGFTLVGHTFNEWTEDDEDITISNNQFTMPEHDVVITATWTPKVDKFYDRMHDGTDASHGGIADGDGKYYITREGCSYTVPSLTDNTSGATACHTKHYVLMGWTAESHLNSDGTLKTGHEGNVYTGGGTQTATGATYYAVWAEVEE